MSTSAPLLAQLKHAVELAEQIETLQAKLALIMDNYYADFSATTRTSINGKAVGRRRVSTFGTSAPRINRVSPEGRAKIAEAQRRRWAKWRQS